MKSVFSDETWKLQPVTILLQIRISEWFCCKVFRYRYDLLYERSLPIAKVRPQIFTLEFSRSRTGRSLHQLIILWVFSSRRSYIRDAFFSSYLVVLSIHDSNRVQGGFPRKGATCRSQILMTLVKWQAQFVAQPVTGENLLIYHLDYSRSSSMRDHICLDYVTRIYKWSY